MSIMEEANDVPEASTPLCFHERSLQNIMRDNEPSITVKSLI